MTPRLILLFLLPPRFPFASILFFLSVPDLGLFFSFFFVLLLLLEEGWRSEAGPLLLLPLGGEGRVGVGRPRGVALALAERAVTVRLLPVVGVITWKMQANLRRVHFRGFEMRTRTKIRENTNEISGTKYREGT